jgi:hypothetical protein
MNDEIKQVDIEQLDKQIEAVQKSTKTTFGFMFPIHEFLRLKSRKYYNWHLNPNANKYHIGVSILSTFVIIFIIFAMVFSPVGNIIKASTTWTQSTDAEFNAGVKANVEVVNNTVTLDGETYLYRRNITIDNSAGGNLTNYQVEIDLNSGNFDFSRVQSDGRDIRFLTSDNILLDYYIQSWDQSGQSAKVWVRIPSLVASSTQNVKMIYGNNTVISQSSGDNVFEFFDDFSSGAMTQWTQTSGTWSVVSDDGNNVISSSGSGTPELCSFDTSILGNNYIYQLRAKKDSGGEGFLVPFRATMDANYPWWNLGGWGNTKSEVEFMAGTTVSPHTINTGQWYDIKLKISRDDGKYIGYIDNALQWDVTIASPGSRTTVMGLGSWNTKTFYDQVFVRQYALNEPSVTVGVESSLAQYAPGTLISSKHDTQQIPDYGQISWGETLPADTDIRFQIRSANTQADLDDAVWYGPTSESDYYTISSGENINSVHAQHKWVQYKAYLATDTTTSPTLSYISLSYDPSDVTIDTNTTWGDDVYLVNSLTIEDGADLTLVGGVDLSLQNNLTLDDSSGATNIICESTNTDQLSGGEGCNINVGGDTIIDAGSSISADGQGYDGGAVGLNGKGPGGGTGGIGVHTGGGAGGGHGGRGGAGSAGAGGSMYNSYYAPTDLGSGGGGGENYTGGAGGGAIRLNVGGTLTLNGAITANGNNGNSGGLRVGGGGAGGSVYITTNIISGTGSITVNGGDADGDNGGGGGAGGRVAMYYYDGGNCNNFSILANKGTGYNDGENGTVVCEKPILDHMKFVLGDISQIAGSTNTIKIAAFDQFDNIYLKYEGLKNITFSGASTALDNVSVPTVNLINFGSTTDLTFNDGVSEEASMVLYKAESTRIEATDGTISTQGDPGYGLTIEISSNNATKVNFTDANGIIVEVANQTAGEAINNLYVSALDQYHNVDTNYATGTVTITAASTDAPGIAPDGTLPKYPLAVLSWGVDDHDGVMYFDNSSESKKVVLSKSETNRKIKIDDTDLPNIDSNAFDIVASGADRVSISPSTSQSIIAGEEINFSASAFDRFDNPATDAILWTGTSSAGSGRFDNTDSGNHVVYATANSIDSTHVSVSVSPSTLDHVSIVAHPDEYKAGSSTSLEARSLDKYNNQKTSGISYTWKGTDSPSSNVLSTNRAGQYQTQVIATEGAKSISSPVKVITVKPDDPSKILFTSDSQIIERTQLSNKLSIVLKDKYDNIAPVSQSVDLSITTSSQKGSFFSSQPPYGFIEKLTLSSGSSTGEMYYRDDAVGNPTIEISYFDWQKATQEITVEDTVAPETPIVDYPRDGQVITNTRFPIFYGSAEAESEVVMSIGSSEYIATADVNGNWTYEFADALSDGQYVLNVKSRDQSGNESLVASVTFKVRLDSSDEIAFIGQSARVRASVDNINFDILSQRGKNRIRILPGKEVIVTVVPSENKPVEYVVGQLDDVTYQFSRDNDNYVLTLDPFETKGRKILKVLINYTDNTVEEQNIELLVDPYGYAYEQIGENELRLSGVEVTCYHKDDGQWNVWDASYYDQENPQITTSNGEYAFMVPYGKYYIVASKAGYDDYKSEIIDVQTGEPVNLNIKMKRESSGGIIENLFGQMVRGLEDIYKKAKAVLQPIVDNPGFKEMSSIASYSATFAFAGSMILPGVLNLPLLNPLAKFLAYFLGLFGIVRKNKKPWGRVYDATTGEAISLATVQIFDIDYDRLLDTQTTDESGRYGFMVKPGNYILKVEKKDYKYPSEIYKGGYRGQKIIIKDNDAHIKYDIPLDVDNQKLAKRVGIVSNVLHILNIVKVPILIIGTLMSVCIAIVYPTMQNWILVSAYMIIWTIEIVFSIINSRSYGRVLKAQTKDVIASVIVRIFDDESGKLIKTSITNREGKFVILAKNGKYKLTFTKYGYKNTQIDGLLLSKDTVIKKDYYLKELS